ncbi:gliding motility-associated C-terminal domain-containing protein [Sediminicola sp. 1XM1-17]|uniref:T9SS type B sorting domain-containing protein n=1 Tax=Sediminicola sp. 1XM1-17 TaxID=3127702 RepID=UPI00307776A4
MTNNTRKKVVLFCCFIFLSASIGMSAQSGNGANFGIEADTYSGIPDVNTDDWFIGTSGLGVIDESSQVLFKNYIDTGENKAFEAFMSEPNYSNINGKLWYGSIFAHDYIAEKNDKTTFGNGKNGDNPANWVVKSSSISKKADIVDAFVHVRRNGITPTDELWVNMAVSTSDNGGAHYTDVEFFIEELKLTGNTFSNVGTDEGHTSWEFDDNGKVTKIGDLDVGFDYSGSSVMSLDIRIWISRKDYLSNTGFQYTGFDGESLISKYGYAHVNYGGNTYSKINGVPTDAPPWGTFNTDLSPSSTYSKESLAEVGINFTGLGFDPATIFGLEGTCYFPYSAVLVKTRGSASFNSGLVDFSGPFPFLGTAKEGAIDTSIALPANFTSCTGTETLSLQANFKSPTALYFWKSLTEGVTFINGTVEMEGVGLDEITINQPGTYELNIAPCEGCIPDPSNVTTVIVYAQPCAKDDMVMVNTNNSIVIQALENDKDLDQNIDITSINNSGLLQPSHGNLSIAKSTGELHYTPNPGFIGVDTFEYQICDTTGLCDIAKVTVETLNDIPPPFDDSDGDGILDRSDLDDDNDGIPDLQELNTVIANSQPQCGGETTLDFSANAVLVSGDALKQGAVYRIPNVTGGTDALVTIVQIYNATVKEIDNNSKDKPAFRPFTAFNFTNKGDQGLIEYKIRFVTAGGSSPVVLDRILMNFNDIDGTNQYGEQTWSYNPTSYVIANPTELTMSTDGKWVIGTGGNKTYPGANNKQSQVNFGVNYNSRSEITIRVGAVARIPGASSTERQHNIEFGCVTNYIDPQVFGLDNDSDGVTNQLDLDVDNDGIYDAVEAGHEQPHTNGVVNGSFGANGLADVVETTVDSGIINFTIRNTDGSQGPDYMDTDSDDDGCSDANEAYFNMNADKGDNEYYGLGNPPKTNADGVVIGATYQTPADIDKNGIYEFRENTAPTITSQPKDLEICPENNATFSVTAIRTDHYQWQLFNGTTWVDLSDAGIYSGTNTDTLQITNATILDNGNQYRVMVSNDTYICPADASASVTLTVNTPPVVTANASSTKINSGEPVTLTGAGADSYMWDNGAVDGVPVILFSTTTFTVIGTNANGCEHTDSITIEVNGTADLSLNKDVDISNPNVGDTVLFTLTVTNDGPDDATNVTVVDNVPSGFSIGTIGNGGTLNANTITWILPSVGVGTQVLTYEAVINAPSGTADEYKNIAEITQMDQVDPDSAPNNDDNDQSEDDEDSHTIPIPTVDLAIDKTVNKPESFIGDTVVFTITVTNNGPYAATNVGITDVLPAGYAFVSSTSTSGSYDQSSSVWKIPSIGVGQTANLKLTVEVASIHDYNNIASLSFVDQTDPNSQNNKDEIGITINEFSDLSLKKTVNTTNPNVGDTVIFSLIVTNDGPNDATNVTIVDQVPSGFALGNINNGGILEGNIITWEIPKIEIGDKILTYETIVLPPTGAAGEYKNIAGITKMDQNDPDSSPNNDSNDQSEDDEDNHTIPTPTVDLSINKKVDRQEAMVGDIVVFSVTVTNNGPYDATNVEIRDVLPKGYQLVSSKVDNGSYNQTSSLWEIPFLRIGATSLLEMTATVTAINDYVNIAILTYADQIDPNTNNDMAETGIDLLEEQSVEDECLVIYNEFSPNNDGLNDVFFIECIEDYPNNFLQIFNRWGNKVFQKKGYKNDWQGTVSETSYYGKDMNLPVGTYYFLLDFGDGKTPVKSGWIYISR